LGLQRIGITDSFFGRLDLTQAESIADLVGARSPQAAQTALAGLQGKLAAPIRHLRASCLEILMDLAINQRQAAALTRARTSLEQVQATISQQLPLDFWTIDLRGVIQPLGEIIGKEVTESVLDRIFSRFCIGK